jgi:hypothetical protein
VTTDSTCTYISITLGKADAVIGATYSFTVGIYKGTYTGAFKPYVTPASTVQAAQTAANNAQIPIGGCIALIKNSAPTAYGTWTYLGSTTAGSTTIYIYNRTA